MDVSEGEVVVCVVCWGCRVGFVSVCHFRVVFRAVLCAVGWFGGILWWYRVEKFGALGVRGYDCYSIAVVEGEVGIDKDEEVGDGGGEGESGG